MKFDKHMKATNNLNADLKDEICELQDRLSKKQIKDDKQDSLNKEQQKMLEQQMEKEGKNVHTKQKNEG